jgi:hypothetical protein
MQVSNEQVFSALNAIRELVGKELPVSAAFRIRKLNTELVDAWKQVEATKDDLLKWHAEKDAEGKIKTEQVGESEVAVFLPEKREAFDNAWRHLLQESVEIHTTLPLAALGDTMISPAVLINLGDLVTEE